MIETTFTFLGTYYPQVLGYALLVFIVAWLASKTTTFYAKTAKLHTDMPIMQTTLIRIDRGLSTLNTVLLERTIISQSCYSGGSSPRTVSALGKDLLRESGADKIFEADKNDLVAELETKTINSLLELEKEALNVMLAHRDDLNYKPLQDFAFQHPTYKNTPLTYTDILFVIALKLRDFYRTRHIHLTAD